MTDHEKHIRSLLAAYERSLNTSDAALAASCYTPDGNFIPTTLPTAGGANMQGAYRQIFDAIRLDVTLAIDEIVITSDVSAYSLTRSNGTQTVLATGDQTSESNREIFPSLAMSGRLHAKSGSATAWTTAATLCRGVSVGLLMPFALWAIALGLTWSSRSSEPA